MHDHGLFQAICLVNRLDGYTGCDEQLAIKLHEAVIRVKQAAFRGDPIKENRIKRELFKVLNDKAEVERVYKIIEKQREY